MVKSTLQVQASLLKPSPVAPHHPRRTLCCYHQPAVGQAHTSSAWSGKPQKRKLRDLRGLSPKVCIGNLDPESSTNLLISQNFSTKFPSLKLDQIRLWSQSTRVTSSQKPNVQNGLHFPDFQWRRDGYLKIEHFNPKRFCLKTYCRYPNCDGLSSSFKKPTAREHTSFSFIFRHDWKIVPESTSVVELLQYPFRLHGKSCSLRLPLLHQFPLTTCRKSPGSCCDWVEICKRSAILDDLGWSAWSAVQQTLKILRKPKAKSRIYMNLLYISVYI